MRTFGNYELVGSLATGGMSTVWLARSPGADGVVVLKRLLREHLGEPDVVAMFHDEAALGELLRHPNLVRQYEHGFAEGEPFIVLERLEGEDVRSLRRAIRKKGGAVPLDVALEIVIAACAGLHAAHELRGPDGAPLGVVHRDVSPHNVIVTFDGEVKVLDFGIAKSGLRRVKTRAGVLKGKVPYMAPEQIRSEPVDRRTDIYALGVMLYELTAGERPYSMQSPSEFGLMMAIVRGEIRPPSALRADYPPALEAIVMRVLSGTPQHRPATAAELASQLDDFRRAERLRGGRDVIRAWMTAHFADRILALRAAASEEELAARMADAEQRRRAANDEDDDEDTARKAPPRAAGAAGAQYALSRRPLGAAVLATLSGRINESFDGAAAGRAIAESKLVVMDLSGVERVTSYGVREWLAMLAACKATELWLARCSDAMLAQLSTVKGFSGHARVAGVLLSFRCDTCGTEATLPFDLELDAAELAAGSPAPRPCARCGSEARCDGDPSSLRFAERWIGQPIPPVVRGALAVLDRESDVAPPPIEKVVLGTETHVRIRRALDRRGRFRRLLDGIEGHLRVEIRDPAALDDRASAELGRALLELGPEVTSITVHGATRALAAALAGPQRPAPAGPPRERLPPTADVRVQIPSWFAAARCPRCDASRTVLVTPGKRAVCGRCGSKVELLVEDDPPPVSLARARLLAGDIDAEPASMRPERASREDITLHEAAPRGGETSNHAQHGSSPPDTTTPVGTSPVGTPPAESSPVPAPSGDPRAPAPRPAKDGTPLSEGRARRSSDPQAVSAPSPATLARFSKGPLAAIVLAAAALVVAVAWLRWAGGHGASSATAQSASQPSAPASVVAPRPGPTAGEGVEQRDGAREITAIGHGPTDEAALASARVRALVLLVESVRAALPPEVRDISDRTAGAAAPDDVARRYLQHMGAGAAPERTATRPVQAPGQRALEVLFRVSEATYQQAVARWGTPSVFRGIRVVPVLPTVADAGWLVVGAPPGPSAPRVPPEVSRPDGAPSPDVRVGDLLVAIGSVTLTPADLPSAPASAEPELRVVRGKDTLRIRWPHQEPSP